MKRRVARLLEGGVDPNAILPVTFTRVAAEDLHRELVGMGVAGCEALEGMTLHGLALRILMRNHALVATGRFPRPLNDFELKPLEADLAGAHGGVREVRKKIKAYEAGWARLQQDEPGYVQSAEDAAFERDLVGWLNFHRSMLIGEVIPQLYNYLHSNPRAPERTEFEHILVDEFQDLNRAEQGVIALLADRADVCIVGDDDQSIYSFKHAHPEGIRDWLNDHAGADDLSLDECRRCPTQVVAMANALIANNVGRPVPRALVPLAENGAGDVRIVQYETLEDEISGVVDAVRAFIAGGALPGDILVLAQRGAIGTPIYEGLLGNGIPARSYYAEAELDAEDAQRRFALLKLFVDAEDRVALRWLLGLHSPNWQCAGYGRLRTYADNAGLSPWQALCRVDEGAVRLPHVGRLVERFREIRADIDRLAALHRGGGTNSVIDDLFPADDETVRDLRALALNILAENEDAEPQEFLSELTSAIAKPEIPSEVQDVRIMSLHKSKGLSAPVTIIAGCVEGLLPKQPDENLSAAEVRAQTEEQRRLFFVGISRVKADPRAGKPGSLLLTYARQMSRATAMRAGIAPAHFQYGEARLNASRFIRELGPAAPRPIPG
jgi:superfamily I DNA/RNA helicase